MSTPAISHTVRVLNKEQPNSCFGAIILTASHNPGGSDEDFGIKFNNAIGAPASETVTNKLFECTKKIEEYSMLDYDGFSIKENSQIKIEGGSTFAVQIICRSIR